MILIAFITWKTVITFMFVTLFILLAIILYKKLISNLKKDNLNLVDYCVLYSFERDEQTGSLEFYFTNDKPKNIIFEILNENHELIHTLADQEYKSGGHIIRFDSTELANGYYYYQLRTENQKTTKKMNIKN